MANENLRDKLLNVNGASSIDNELAHLRAIGESVERRARRIAHWTLGVWIVAGACWFLMILLTMLNRNQCIYMTVGTSNTMWYWSWFMVACGIIFLIVLFFARRRATMMQIKNSMLVIETQLKLLTMEHKKDVAGPPKAVRPD